MKSITDDLSESNIEKIFNGIDSSGDMRIDFMEFKVEILIFLIFPINLMENLQVMMKKITESGWKKVESDTVKEEDIRALFDMIDKDKSGSLSKRV